MSEWEMSIQAALENALCAWEDHQKAEEGFGPLDIGWYDPQSGLLKAFLDDFVFPHVMQAVEQTRGDEAERAAEVEVG